MKRAVTLILTVLTIMILVISLPTTIYAEDASENPYDGDTYKANTLFKGHDNVTKVGNAMLGVLQVVGNIVAIGILTVLGIKYMVGSAEEKASYKKTMMPYLIGAILIFAASNIAGYIWSIANGI